MSEVKIIHKSEVISICAAVNDKNVCVCNFGERQVSADDKIVV